MGNFSIDEIVFSWYEADIKKIKPKGDITLRQFINSVVSPKESLKDTFKKIEEASLVGNKELKAELKKGLFAVTPCVKVKGVRNYESIISHNEILVIEYDGIENSELLRDYIFDKFKSCVFAFKSPSGGGCKFIFRIPKVNNTPAFKELFFGLAYELDKFKNLDLSGANCVLPLFVSWDENARIRENPTVWTKRGYKEGSFTPFEGEFEISEDVSDEDKQRCFEMVRRMINKIEENGHPQVRSSAIIGGGVTAFYGLDQDEMWDLIEDRIRENAYLSKDIKNYLTTAKTLYNKGLLNPVALPENDKYAKTN
jgi:hypothetical protein|nr:MAG TPA: VirE-like protein [Caudoviricetes sp.]